MITMEIMMMIWWWSRPQTHPNDDDNDDNQNNFDTVKYCSMMVLENVMWCDGWWLNMIMMTDDWNENDVKDDDKMTWWHDDMTLPWSLITILCLLSKVYRLKCLKFETKTHSLTHLLTRVKSRNASPANEKTSLLSLLAPKELYMWYYPALTTQHHPHFEHTPVLSNNFDYWCCDDFVDCDFYDH